MKSTRIILVILTLSLLGVSGTAFANEDLANAGENSNPKVQVKQWFEGMGIDTTTDGFAKDMFNLMTGIDQRLSPSANFTVSAGSGLRMGFSWK